jgi:hypothetical protein
MVLKDFLAISGEPGLFKFIAQGKNAIIVEHLETKKRSSAFGSAKVSSLEEISVFTDGEDMPLSKIFDLIYEKENGGPAIDYKSEPDKLKEYFVVVLPQYDKQRVYVSDIKKILHWYNLLQQLNLLVKEEPKKEPEPDQAEPVQEASPEKAEGTSESKPAKKVSKAKATKGEGEEKKKTPKTGGK